MKKNQFLKIVITCIFIVLVGILWYENTKIRKPHKQSQDFILVEKRENTEELEKDHLFKSYEDYSYFFQSDKIQKNEFENYNFLLITIPYNSCSEENITPVDYFINNNEVTIKIEYTKKCGYCAALDLYYLLKIEKADKTYVTKNEYIALNHPNCDFVTAKKPILYLYPEEATPVRITFPKKENLTTTYPLYKNAWEVEAYPDGTLKDTNGREYYGLYWEGKNHSSTMKKEGFVVKKEDTINFLEEKLNLLGLTNKEANEFIIYWLPVLERNEYNYIYFETTEEVNHYMPLEINPEPDAIIRIIMDYRPLTEKMNVKEQELITPTRKGFTVVEWGGSLIEE